MKQINFTLLAAGILFGCFFQVARADVLDNWTTNQVNTNSAALKHIVYANGHYVAVGQRGDEGDIYSSEDGIHWTLRYTDQNSWGLTIAYSSGRFVGVGGWETAISADSTNWTVSFLPSNYLDRQTDMTFGNSRYVVVGDTNNIGIIITSTDGTTWTPRTAATMGGHISSIIYSGTKFVAIGNNDGYEYTASSTATTWTRSSIPGGNQISYGNGLYFVPLNNKTNLISTDGNNWSLNATGLTNQLGKITYANGIFLARSGNYLTTSSNGTNWFQYPQTIPGFEIASDGKRLATIGSILVDFNNQWNNSFVYASDVLVSVRQTNKQPSNVILSGLVGRNYQIQFADSLGSSSNWSTNTSLQLTNTPFIWTDVTATNAARFYRAVLMP